MTRYLPLKRNKLIYRFVAISHAIFRNFRLFGHLVLVKTRHQFV